MFVHPGVGIESAATLAVDTLEARHVVGAVDAQNVDGLGRLGCDADQVRPEIERIDPLPCGTEPIGTFGVLAPGHMVEASFMGHEHQRHSPSLRGRQVGPGRTARATTRAAANRNPREVSGLASERGSIGPSDQGRAQTVKNLTVGRGRTVRVGPWRGDHSVATVSTFVDQPLDNLAVAGVIENLRSSGFQRTVTAALAPHEHDAFLANGFTRVRELTLLRRDLDHPIKRADMRLRRWRRRNHDEVLTIDNAAFDEFWRFDASALREALDATPHRVLRVDATTAPQGYALSGVARGTAYLQRLAVHPDAAGRGLGTALLLDALRWMRWRGATHAYVNTQHDNHRALELYHRNEFVDEPAGLTIFERDL